MKNYEKYNMYLHMYITSFPSFTFEALTLNITVPTSCPYLSYIVYIYIYVCIYIYIHEYVYIYMYIYIHIHIYIYIHIHIYIYIYINVCVRLGWASYVMLVFVLCEYQE